MTTWFMQKMHSTETPTQLRHSAAMPVMPRTRLTAASAQVHHEQPVLPLQHIPVPSQRNYPEPLRTVLTTVASTISHWLKTIGSRIVDNAPIDQTRLNSLCFTTGLLQSTIQRHQQHAQHGRYLSDTDPLSEDVLLSENSPLPQSLRQTYAALQQSAMVIIQCKSPHAAFMNVGFAELVDACYNTINRNNPDVNWHSFRPLDDLADLYRHYLQSIASNADHSFRIAKLIAGNRLPPISVLETIYFWYERPGVPTFALIQYTRLESTLSSGNSLAM